MKLKVKANVNINENDIFNDLKKFADTYGKVFMWEAADIIADFAFKQMSEYYDEYTPKYYSRSFLMMFFSYKKYQVHSGNTYEGGILIDSSFTNHELDSEYYTEDYIYSDVWIKGKHGDNKGKADRFGRLKKKAFSKGTMSKLDKIAMKTAKSQSYSIINFK